MPDPSPTPREPRSDTGGEPLGHLRRRGEATEAQMVDVGAKSVTERRALARARIRFPAGVLGRVLSGAGPKGAVEEVARVAGVLAAKRTGDLIPMCHPLGLDHVEITFDTVGEDLLEVRCAASCRARTGVEMEAMVGASVSALTVYDMAKGVDKGIRIEAVELLEKSGGKSGSWRAPGGSAP